MDPVDALTRLGGVARLRDLERLTTRHRLRSAVADGRIRRLGRGRCALPTSWPALLLAAELGGYASHLCAAAEHASRDDHDRDCVRYNALTATGWRVLRFTYDHVMSSPRYVMATIRELLAEVAA